MKKLILAGVIALAGTSAHAAQVPFTGLVDATCTLGVTKAGDLKLTGPTVLETATGADEARVRAITTNAGFTITTQAPTTWTLPAVGAPSTSFEVKHSVGGNLLDVASTPSIDLPVGLTDIAVAMKATASDPFTQGAYAAEVTVTCETSAGT